MGVSARIRFGQYLACVMYHLLNAFARQSCDEANEGQAREKHDRTHADVVRSMTEEYWL
jgi:hypothetical protein